MSAAISILLFVAAVAAVWAIAAELFRDVL